MEYITLLLYKIDFCAIHAFGTLHKYIVIMANQNQEALKEACAKEEKSMELGMYEYNICCIYGQ